MSPAPTRERRDSSVSAQIPIEVGIARGLPGQGSVHPASEDGPIDGSVPRPVWPLRVAPEGLWWRLKFNFWRGLEAVVSWVVLDHALHREVRQSSISRRAAAVADDDFSRRQLSVGHGCPGPDLLVGSVDANGLSSHRKPGPRQIEVCIVGSSTATIELIRCLVTLGANVHATAETVDDYVLLRAEGATPHRFEDLPAVATGLDVLISTSFSWFVGARIVARLPEWAVIVDTAGPPGSVDFETSRRLGREVLWERNLPSSSETWVGTWKLIHTLVCKREHGFDPSLPDR